jgi:hypothetical protein
VKIESCAAFLIIALCSGCGTTGGSRDSTPAEISSGAATATDTSVAPLGIPSASAKRLTLNMTGPALVTQAKD